MKYILRDYQKETVDKAVDYVLNGRIKDRPIIVAPTAAGKSLMIAGIADALDCGIIVLNPSKELLAQNYEKYTSYGNEASIYSASMGEKEVGRVTFATIGSVKDKPELFEHVKVIITDECEQYPPAEGSMFTTFINGLGDVKVIGLTATPYRLKNYRDQFTDEPYSQINLLPRERPRFFNTFLHVIQVSDMYSRGYLSPLVYQSTPWDSNKLELNTTGAEFSEKSVDRELIQQKVYEQLPEQVQYYKMFHKRKHILVFVKDVESARKLAEITQDSAYVCGETKQKERDKIISDFKSGKISVVYNVGVLVRGFDYPEIDMVVLARPTMSTGVYIQMIGRGVRVHPDKEDCIILDMCGNVGRHCKFEKVRYDIDVEGKWIMHDGTKVLTGVRMKK